MVLSSHGVHPRGADPGYDLCQIGRGAGGRFKPPWSRPPAKSVNHVDIRYRMIRAHFLVQIGLFIRIGLQGGRSDFDSKE